MVFVTTNKTFKLIAKKEHVMNACLVDAKGFWGKAQKAELVSAAKFVKTPFLIFKGSWGNPKRLNLCQL